MNFKSLKYGLMHGLVIINFAGNPYVQLKEEKVKPKLKDNLSLKSDTYIRTNPTDYVVLNINDRYQVTVLPDSIFTIDGIRDKDKFNIRSVYIRRGQIYIKEIQDSVQVMLKNNKVPFKNQIKTTDQVKLAQRVSSDETEVDLFEPLKIESDFFSFLTQKDQKLSLFVKLNLKEAILNVCNLSPNFKLELFDHEQDQDLKMNEGIQFNGSLDKSGRIAYDLLLEKRKIPKGKWGVKETCAIDQVKKIQDQVVQLHLKSQQQQEMNRLKKIADKKRNDLLFLCHDPYGQLDQCHFVLRQNKCIRERCNAEGKWTDQTEIGVIKNLCSVQGEVRACGY